MKCTNNVCKTLGLIYISYVLLYHRAQPGTMVGTMLPFISSLTLSACALRKRIIKHIYVGIHKGKKSFFGTSSLSMLQYFFSFWILAYLWVTCTKVMISIIDMNVPILLWHTPLEMFHVDCGNDRFPQAWWPCKHAVIMTWKIGKLHVWNLCAGPHLLCLLLSLCVLFQLQWVHPVQIFNIMRWIVFHVVPYSASHLNIHCGKTPFHMVDLCSALPPLKWNSASYFWCILQ